MRRMSDAPDLGEVPSLWQRARRAFPGVDLEEAAFAAHLERTQAGPPAAPIPDLHIEDLYLAAACVARVPGAARAFDERYRGVIRAGVAQANLPEAIRQEVTQVVFEKLLVGRDGTPRLAEYRGRGSLAAWARVVAVREALSRARRGQREIPTDDWLIDLVPDGEHPEVALLKQVYRREFKVAFEEALASLTSRQRNLLRYQLLERLSIDELGAVYGVHRATAARWLAATREALLGATRERLVGRLGISDDEFASVMRLIESRLDVSVHRFLDVTLEE